MVSLVLHIRKSQFNDLQRESKRLLKSSGKASHSIDFQDHLDYGLNNLRFSKDLESNFKIQDFIPIEFQLKNAFNFRELGFKVKLNLWEVGKIIH